MLQIFVVTGSNVRRSQWEAFRLYIDTFTCESNHTSLIGAPVNPPVHTSTFI